MSARRAKSELYCMMEEFRLEDIKFSGYKFAPYESLNKKFCDLATAAVADRYTPRHANLRVTRITFSCTNYVRFRLQELQTIVAQLLRSAQCGIR